VIKVSEIRLKGSIIGFEEFEDYILDAPFGEDSPFRILRCMEGPYSFVVVNPYNVMEDYTIDIDEKIAYELVDIRDANHTIAVLCIVRPVDNTLYVNLRSPIIINTARGMFIQVILQNEGYGVSVPFAIQKED